MKSILVIDSDGLCWSVFHALPPLTYKEQGTAVIYGFLNQLFDLQAYYKADRIAFAWDSANSKRREIFPEYKLKRNQAKKEYTEKEKALHKDRAIQFKLLRKEILPALGFSNIFREDGFEGDDIIASISKKYSKKNFVTIVSRDGDMYQLINKHCTMFDTVKRKRVDEEVFFERYGIYPDMWAEVKSIAGCATDEVPGVPGFKEERAIKYLLGNMKTSSVLYKRVLNSPEAVELSRKLTSLPFEGTPSYKLVKDHCTVKALKSIAREYNLRSYLSKERLRVFRKDFVTK